MAITLTGDLADAISNFAARVVEGSYMWLQNGRHDYGEDRFVAIGPIDEAGIVIVVFVAWTLRPGDGKRICRIFSARKANAAERKAYGAFQG